ncbi:MAG: zf-HC2 domain-containing protein [Pirellulaceae bacterium]|nr:zf-HC2 domain-containing protein [Pirellulaceae bacterium]
MGSRKKTWSTCRKGEIGKVAISLRAKRRTGLIRYCAVALSTVAILLSFTSIFYSLQDYRNDLRIPAVNLHTAGGIDCTDMYHVYPDYQEGQLSDELTRRAARHLSLCPNCKQKYTPEKDKNGSQTKTTDLPQTKDN